MILRSKRVLLPDGIAPAIVSIDDGQITAISSYDAAPAGSYLIDCQDSVLMAGVVDPHVHINDPGRSSWEGFESATRAAAAGGTTTVVDMPLNSIPATTSLLGWRAKQDAARGKCWINVRLWGGVVPGNSAELRPLWQAGVLGFKCFLTPSGVDEFRHVTESDLREAMPILTRLGAPVLVHAELPEFLTIPTVQVATGYFTYLASRPHEAENQAIALMIRLCREFGTRVHIVHLSSADALPMIRLARAEGLPLTVETCPHYLLCSAEEIPDGATHFKCTPPIRERENRERLWQALAEGVIDFVATDHSPCPAALKLSQTGNFLRSWGGIASLGLALPLLWTAARRRGIALDRLADWLCRRPAEFCGLGRQVGTIAPGKFADIVRWNPEAQREWRGYHKMTPYAGEMLYGEVEQTYLRGKLIYDYGQFGAAPQGQCE